MFGQVSVGAAKLVLAGLLFLSPALAQDLALGAGGERRIDGGGTLVQPPPRVEDLAPGEADDASPPLDLDDLGVTLELPTYRWLPRDPHGADFLRQVSLTRLPPGSLVIRYEGIEGYVVRKAQGRLKKEWSNTLRDAWEGRVLDDDEFEHELQSMYESLGDFRAGGRWWERSWLDSLPPEKGGAPAMPFVQTIGERLEVLRLGPLVLTNDLRARIDGFTVLNLDPDGGQIFRSVDIRRLAREHAQLRRDDVEDELPALGRPGEDEDDGLAEPIMRLTLEPPDPRLLPANWRLRFRPTAGVRLTDDVEKAVRDVALRVTLELYLGAKRQKFMEIEAMARYRPASNEAQLGIQIALVTW